MSAPNEHTDETVEASPGAADRQRERELRAGASLGKYRLDRILGSGGMGVVWAAHDPDLERAVALKVLRYDNASVELRSRLLREARAMARLKHPNVLTVYEVDSEGDRDYIAMELVEGGSLDGWLESKPPRDAIWKALLAAGHGLASAHRAGLVHRDFKPHNVLRSHDGRVLVTDFGLARAHGETTATPSEVVLPERAALEETLAATATSAKSSPSSLDGQLTQTGALIGTPAYMAPEQFLGAGSDPRTDQFAFCVTAWQLLAGERPFGGTTLDELRRAASGGIANARGKVPRAVRRVLARGLAPDPAQRWPDMDALLVALERAKDRPRKLAMAAGITWLAIFGIVMVSIGASRAGREQREAALPATSSASCDTESVDEIAKAWSPGLRAEIAQRFRTSPDIDYVLAAFDDWRTHWTADYKATCERARSTRKVARLGCLLAERDAVAGLTELIPTAPPNAFEGAELGGILPRIEACDGDSPMTLPGLPDDAGKRARIKAMRPKILASHFAQPKEFLVTIPALIAEAEAIGWDPLLAEAHQAFAIAGRRSGEQWELVRDHYKLATQIARRAHHYHLEADGAVGLLVGEIDAASDPSDDKAFEQLVSDARAAVHNAGDDPAFLARILQVEGQFAYSRGRPDDVVTKYEQARATELAAHNFASACRYTADAVLARLRRGRPDDLAAAAALLADTERAVAGAKLVPDKLAVLWATQTFVAQLRGDLATAHAYADRLGPPKPPADAVAVSGRVVDDANQPVAGARVVAWRGLLIGDGERVNLPARFDGDIAASDAAGNFTVRAPRGGGVIAELGARRSSPRVVDGGPLVLALAPTRAIAGTVASDGEALTGVAVATRFTLAPGTFWDLTTAAGRDGAYQLAGLPSGAAVLRLDTPLDPNAPIRKLEFGPVRDHAALRWPVGPALDVIVHDPRDDLMIFVFRGAVTAKTRGELAKRVDAAREVTLHQALIVGIGDQTPAAMHDYRRGDHHGVFLNTAPGAITVCIAGRAPESPASCKPVSVPKLPRTAALPVVFDSAPR